MENTCCFCEKASDAFCELTAKNFCIKCSSRIFGSYRHKTWDHVKLRLLNRYGILLTVNLYHEILNAIKSGTSVNLGDTDGGRRTLHKVDVLGIECALVYEVGSKGLSKEGVLITALPKASNVKLSSNGTRYKYKMGVGTV